MCVCVCVGGGVTQGVKVRVPGRRRLEYLGFRLEYQCEELEYKEG